MHTASDAARNVLHAIRFACLLSDGHASALRNRHHGAVCSAVKLYAEADKRTVACNSFRTIESE
ncbi:hypothetical protein BZM27_43245 [Paraburkholderia steynii]|uniref:Uncharacterized protein n=1 Tax=Paraburkholderia steynii TaxID=1245441 RepID=A0A4V2NGA9_9BURK|nr:hypothetical protein BZM27_43245 [Paraburkholderia steynii]